MSHKAKVSGSEKIAAVEKYLRGEDSLNHLAKHFLMYAIHPLGNGFRLTSR
ncbi:hypothetical protein [Paenibacillus larvae]|uniref:hypothetical protein n=1 Tax=Paenibacillus larvae TaxID=1464 RepID=UPI00288CA57C|nr:hypothetical protein [Paenibacillus larvae]MDT2277858.1 hypothetical protein [Paenibacillus larvae]